MYYVEPTVEIIFSATVGSPVFKKYLKYFNIRKKMQKR
jgi:hypothetical protein